MPPRRRNPGTGSSRGNEEEQNPANQPPQNQEIPPPPPPNVAAGGQVPVDAAQLMQAVNALLGVVTQQQQTMRQDMQVVQANAEAWRQEAQRNNGNGGQGARHPEVLSLNKFVDLVYKFEPHIGKPLEAQLWIEEVEKTFAALDIPDNKKVEYASYLLIGRANN